MAAAEASSVGKATSEAHGAAAAEARAAETTTTMEHIKYQEGSTDEDKEVTGWAVPR